MPTLQDLRKKRYKTIKAFAEAYGCGASKASGILNGRYHLTLAEREVMHLAFVLGIGFIECADACDNTFAEYKGYKGDAWKQSKRRYNGILHKGIWARWQWEEDLLRDTRNASKSGDWEAYRRKYTTDYQAPPRASTPPPPQTCFGILGIPITATPEQIKHAFRVKVKALADGKGGYNGDMDRLVQAKEEAMRQRVRK